MGRQSILPQISFSEISFDQHYLIDVRSPGEFYDFHIPGSINIPLFSDDERKEVGTLYKQDSPEAAKKRGVALFGRKLTAFYEKWVQLQASQEGKEAVVMCARGGMRSATFVSMMEALGINAYQLSGGIRSYREYVRSQLDYFSKFPWKGIALSGNTGTGKTKWLKELMEKGYPVLDLEGIANHRGSIFGHIGRGAQSQKQFEYELVEILKSCEGKRWLILEAESKRIGSVIVPDFLLQLMDNSVHIVLNDTLERRVNRIIGDYQPQNYHEEFVTAYTYLRKRLVKDSQTMIDDAFCKKDYHSAFSYLLTHYYDPRYEYSRKDYNDKNTVSLDISNYLEHEIIAILEKIIWEQIG